VNFFALDYIVSSSYKYVSGSVPDFPSEYCTACGKIQLNDVVVPHKLDSGRYYPDFMHIDDWVTYSVLSERFINTCKDAGLTGLCVKSEFVLLNKDETPIAEPEMRYFAVEFTGKIRFDLKAMHLKLKHSCNCGYKQWNREKMGDVFYDESSWSGDDFSTVEDNPHWLVCTQRVLDVLHKHKFRGIQVSYGHDLFRLRHLDLKAHQKMLKSGEDFHYCYKYY